MKGFSDTYSAAARNIVTVLDAAATTSATITRNVPALDSLLLNVAGLSRSGTNLIGPNKDNLVHGINLLESTTRLLMKYNPELTCTLVGGKNVLDFGFLDVAGGHNGYSVILDVALLLGDDTYRFPDNLPINGAKGGPGGQPGCGSLPDVAKNFPQRYLVTNTGWGTGMDVRPTRASASRIRRLCPGHPRRSQTTQHSSSGATSAGSSPGTAGYNSPAPYGAPQYAPDGTPLFPGLPPAPPPGGHANPDRRRPDQNRSCRRCPPVSNRPAESSISSACSWNRRMLQRPDPPSRVHTIEQISEERPTCERIW
ncbi:hypothetical protein I552_2527 [Mycobacterium xenopi 3993]|nr:hypothetical protein I552_2527 [Mycobacterium xenopi 3993]